MSAHWTDRDPGVGDIAACVAAAAWADEQLVELANAQDTVSSIRNDLDGAWIGRAADAFRHDSKSFAPVSRSRLRRSPPREKRSSRMGMP